MTREDIIRLYEKANGWSPAAYANTVEELERFAALVAAAEREACAKVCEEQGESPALAPLEKYRASFIADAIRTRGKK